MDEDSRNNVFCARFRKILRNLSVGSVAITREARQRCRRCFRVGDIVQTVVSPPEQQTPPAKEGRIDEKSDEVQLRARMHDAIEQRTHSDASKEHCLNEVRECINSAPDQKVWLSPGEPYVSAMRKAVEKNAFDVCGLLRSCNCQFKDMEEKSCLEDLDPLRHRELRRQTTIFYECKKFPLNRLTGISIMDSGQLSPSEWKTKAYSMYKKLHDIELVRPILRAAATAPGLEIHFDFDSDNLTGMTPDGKCYRGQMIVEQHQILIGAKREENEVLGTLAHELCHFVLMLVYKNGSLPYWRKDTQTANSYARIFDDIRNTKNSSMNAVMRKAFLGGERDTQLKELIARVPHVLATYGSPGEGDSILQQEAKELPHFFATDVVPKVNAYVDGLLPVKEVQNIEVKNRTLGKALEVEKHDIVFEKAIPDLCDAPLQVLSGPSLPLLEIMVNDSVKWTFKPYLFLNISQWDVDVDEDYLKTNRCDIVVLTVDETSRLKGTLEALIEIVEVTGLKVILLVEEDGVPVILQEAIRVEISGISLHDIISRQIDYACLDNVTAECKERIYLSSKVRLQGSKEFSLSQVLNSRTFLELVDETMFLSLSRKEVICIGTPLEEHEGDDARCYIARKCTRALYVDLQRVHVGRKQEVFALCGCPSKSVVPPEHARATHFIDELKQLDGSKFAHDPQFILVNNAGEYDALLEWVCKEKTAHLLMYEDARKCFVWKKSNGPMSHILKSDTAECYDASALVTTNDKTVVVCGPPGIGKSLMSKSLGKEIRNHDEMHWVIRIDLSKKNRELRSRNAEDVVNDPIKVAKFCSVKEGSHDMTFFKQSITTGSPFKVVTIFDSFDEIEKKSRKNIIRLVRLLAAREIRVFIFSSSAFKNDLQDELRTVSYEISPFSREDIEEFLEKHMEITASPGGKSRATGLDLYGNVLRRKETVLENPLMLRMMAEVEERPIREEYRVFLEDILHEKESPNSLKVFRLFVDHKRILYHKEKQGSDIDLEAFRGDYDNAKKQFYKEHGLLALKLTLGDDACMGFLNDSELAELEPNGRLMKAASENRMKQGFLSGMCDGRPEFVHRSFADFFAAHFLFEKVMSSRHKDAPVIDAVVGLYSKADYDDVLNFFDEFGAWSHMPHCAILDGDKVEGEHEMVLDKLGRTPVHIAALHEDNDVLRNLRLTQAIRVKDKLGLTPVMYADKTRAFKKLNIFASRCNDDGVNWVEELQTTLENLTKMKDLRNSPLFSLIVNGHCALLNLILKIKYDGEGAQLTCHRTGGVPFENDTPENSRTPLCLLNIDSIRHSDGRTPFHLSCHYGQLGIAKLLVPYSFVNIFDYNGFSPFTESIRLGNMEIMKLLLPFAFLDDVHYRDAVTPLVSCAQTNRADIIHLYLQHHSWMNTTRPVFDISASLGTYTPEVPVGILREILPHAGPDSDFLTDYAMLRICAHWDAVKLVIPYSHTNYKLGYMTHFAMSTQSTFLVEPTERRRDRIKAVRVLLLHSDAAATHRYVTSWLRHLNYA